MRIIMHERAASIPTLASQIKKLRPTRPAPDLVLEPVITAVHEKYLWLLLAWFRDTGRQRFQRLINCVARFGRRNETLFLQDLEEINILNRPMRSVVFIAPDINVEFACKRAQAAHGYRRDHRVIH